MYQIFDKQFLDALLVQAEKNLRLRAAYNLISLTEDASQRILNAEIFGTVVAFIVISIVAKMYFAYTEAWMKYCMMKKKMKSIASSVFCRRC